MAQWHDKSARKASGGRRTTLRRRDKTLAQRGSDPVHTTVASEDRRFVAETKRGGIKVKARKANRASVLDSKTRKVSVCEILNVSENPANRQFARRNIITKGAVIEVKLASGSTVKAKVTSRPGQSGSVQAVLQ